MTTKISSDAASAFLNHEEFKRSNTTVKVTPEYTAMYLHGNCIAQIDNESLIIKMRDCGWATKTTKERLNAILDRVFHGVSIVQRNYEWFFIENSTGDVKAEFKHGRESWNKFWA